MRVKVILNPKAGGGRAANCERTVVELLRELGVDYDIETTRGPGDATRIARAAASAGFDVVASMGGDGTTNEVVNGIADTGVALAVIPAGSGNDFPAALGIPKGDLYAACRAIAAGRVRKVDLCKVNGRYFVSSFGTGFDARVAKAANEKFKFLRGIWVYICSVMDVIWTYRPAPIRVVVDGQEMRLTAVLVAVTNWKTYGGGMMICPYASADDGLLDVCIVDNMSIPRLLMSFPKVIKGTHVTTMREVRMLRAKSVVVECSRVEPFQIDGEILESDRMELTIFPSGIDAIVGEVS